MKFAILNKRMKTKNKKLLQNCFIYKTIVTLIIVSFLCQNVAWAQQYCCLAPKSPMRKSRVAGPTKILLVNIVDKQKVVPQYPLGLYTLKSYIKNNHSSDCIVEVRDIQLDDVDEIIEFAEEWGTDILGLSVKTENMSVFDDFVGRLNIKIPEEKQPLCVVGRQVATFGYQDLLARYPDMVCVRGEGELALAGLHEFIQGKKQMKDVLNLAYTDNGEICETERDLLSDFESMGHVDHSEAFRYVEAGGNIWMEASRGCPWGRCRFCSITEFWGNNVLRRDKPVDSIVDELRQFSNMGIKRFTTSDEEFFGVGMEGVKRARRIAQAIIDSGIEISFHTDIRASSLYNKDEDKQKYIIETLKLLKQAGLRSVFIGIETGSPSQLKRYLKGSTVKTAERAIAIYKELGINIALGFIMLEPLCSKEEILESIDFIRRNELLPYLSVPLNRLRIYTGEPYIDMIREEERELDRKLISDQFDRKTLTYEVVDYKYPAVKLITDIVTDYAQSEYDLYNAIRWFERFNPGIFGLSQAQEYSYLKEAAEKFKEFQIEFLYKLASLNDDDILRKRTPEWKFIEAIRQRDTYINELEAQIREKGHESECSNILLQIKKYKESIAVFDGPVNTIEINASAEQEQMLGRIEEKLEERGLLKGERQNGFYVVDSVASRQVRVIYAGIDLRMAIRDNFSSVCGLTANDLNPMKVEILLSLDMLGKSGEEQQNIDFAKGELKDCKYMDVLDERNANYAVYFDGELICKKINNPDVLRVSAIRWFSSSESMLEYLEEEPVPDPMLIPDYIGTSGEESLILISV